jgi:hypothetical protein
MRFDARALPLALAGARFPLPRLHREREGLRHLSGFPPPWSQAVRRPASHRNGARRRTGPAARAGLRGFNPSTGELGDVTVAANRQPVRGLADLAEQVEWVGVGKPSNSRSGMAEATHQRQLKSLTWKYGRPLLVLEFFDAGPSFSRRAHPVVGALQPTAMLRATISTPRRGAAAGRPLPRDRQAPTPPSPPAEPLRRECGSPADPACARGAPRPCAR